jgi:hypothetical protein
MSKEREKRTNKREQIKQYNEHLIRGEKMVEITKITQQIYKQRIFKYRI